MVWNELRCTYGRAGSPDSPGWYPVSHTTVAPLYLSTQHDRPTSWPAPSIVTSTSSLRLPVARPFALTSTSKSPYVVLVVILRPSRGVQTVKAGQAARASARAFQKGHRVLRASGEAGCARARRVAEGSTAARRVGSAAGLLQQSQLLAELKDSGGAQQS